jgi:hypothetical protein
MSADFKNIPAAPPNMFAVSPDVGAYIDKGFKPLADGYRHHLFHAPAYVNITPPERVHLLQKQLATDFIGGTMQQNAEIRIYRRYKSCHLRRQRIALGYQTVETAHAGIKIALSAIENITAVGQNIRTQKSHSLSVMLQINLIRMQNKLIPATQILTYHRYYLRQPFTTFMNENHIVNVATVVLHAKLILHKMVEIVQINITEKLRRQITYRQAAILTGIKKTLTAGKIAPVATPAAYLAILSRVVENNYLQKILHKLVIKPTLLLMLLQNRHHLFTQKPTVHTHKIALNIKLQNITIPRVVGRTSANKLISPLHTVERTLTLATTVSVIYKMPFKNRNYIITQKMVDDSIAEIRCKNLALHGSRHHKTDAGNGFVTTFDNLIKQLENLSFHFHFKQQSIARISLITARSVVSCK